MGRLAILGMGVGWLGYQLSEKDARSSQLEGEPSNHLTALSQVE